MGRDPAAPSLRLRAIQMHHHWRHRLPWALGAVGAAALVAGVVVLFTTEHDPRSAFLLTLGVVLLIVAALGKRIQLAGFEFLGAKVQVREVVKRRLEFVESADRGSAADETLRGQAIVLQRLVGLYGLYEHIRRTQPPGPERTKDLDDLGERMQAVGLEAEFDPAEVIGWLREGTDALRVIALNLMFANPAYRDFVSVLEIIDAPHSLFEQYYGLRLARRMLPELDPLQRRLLRKEISRAREKRKLRRDAPLMSMSRQILDLLDK
ncbi:MAG TPA: hypothetical protein VLL27_08440 [Solirubrobacterales bacterium]|nr:hypothetical protein [Solirubrobacterales bacterium]